MSDERVLREWGSVGPQVWLLYCHPDDLQPERGNVYCAVGHVPSVGGLILLDLRAPGVLG
jgi:hypothetical protein